VASVAGPYFHKFFTPGSDLGPKEKTRVDSELRIGGDGLDFGLFGSALLLPPTGSRVRFSLLPPDPDWI